MSLISKNNATNPCSSSAKGCWANMADKCNSEGQLSKQMKCMFSSQPYNANQYVLLKNDNFRCPSCTRTKKVPVLRTCRVIFSLCTGQWGQLATLWASPTSPADVLHARPRARGQRLHQAQLRCTVMSTRSWTESTSSLQVHCWIPKKNVKHLLVANWESNKTVLRRRKKSIFASCNPVKKPMSSALVHTQKCCSCLAPGMRISSLQKTYLTL